MEREAKVKMFDKNGKEFYIGKCVVSDTSCEYIVTNDGNQPYCHKNNLPQEEILELLSKFNIRSLWDWANLTLKDLDKSRVEEPKSNNKIRLEYLPKQSDFVNMLKKFKEEE